MEIKLTQNKVSLVDDEDFAMLNAFMWRAQKGRHGFYATTNVGRHGAIQMQNVIIKAPDGMMVDHKDRNGLNNQRNNLRICTYEQNSANRTPAGKSKYLGVSKVKDRERWRAFIGHNRKNHYLGIYQSEDEAALAYNEAALRFKGEFAYVNQVIGIVTDIVT